MKVTRRLFGPAMVGAAAGAKQAANEVAKLSLSELPTHGGAIKGSGGWAEQTKIEKVAEPLMNHKQARKLAMLDPDIRAAMREYLLDSFRLNDEKVYTHWLDPDIDNKRSFSPAYKALMQRERTLEHRVEKAMSGRDGRWGEAPRSPLDVLINKLMWGDKAKVED